MAVDMKFRLEVETVAELLDQLNYYQLLKVQPQASAREIQAAFFQESKRFHPDRYFGLDDEPFKAAVLRVYKRIAEAYGVLKDPELRRAYDEQLAAGHGLRFDREAYEKASRKAGGPAGDARTVKGRKFLVQGLERLRRKDYAGAVMNFKFALDAEPDNEAIKAHLDRAQAALNEQKEANPSQGYRLRF